MKLDRLEIAGFLHFAAPAAIDFAALPPGLIAIRGMNGSGKTRLLDAGPGGLHGPGLQDAAFPSRQGSLAEYATSREAYIDQLWSFESGQQYRCRINVDGVKRNTDALIEEVRPDGLRQPLNDGKITTYREQVSRIFPSRRQLLASAYAAQGRQGSFVALDQKSRLELFAELCDLGHYAEKAETAKRCAVAAEKARSALAALRDQLARDACPPRLAELEEQLVSDALDHEAAIQARESRAQALDDAIRDVKGCQAFADQYFAAAAKAQSAADHDARLQASAAALPEEWRRIEKQLDAELEALKRRSAKRIAELSDRREAAVARHGVQKQDLTQRMTNNRTLLDQAEKIRAAVREKQECDKLLGMARAAVSETFELQAANTRLLAQIELQLTAAVRAQRDLEDARKQEAAIAAAPFGEKCEPCSFMTSARGARHRIPTLERDAGKAADLEASRVKAAANEQAAEKAREEAQRRQRELDVKLPALEKLAKLEAPLAEAQAKISGYASQLVASDEELARVVAEIASQKTDVHADEEIERAEVERRRTSGKHDMAARASELTKQISEAGRDRRAAEAEAERLSSSRDTLAIAEQYRDRLQREQSECASAIARLEARLEAATAEKAALDQKARQLAACAARLAIADRELLAWQLLAKACGRDGLPKLEVDAAGPTISNLANDLLAIGADGFSMEVVTQIPRSDGKGLKEWFDIRVFDNVHGGEPRSISDLSGGERVIVEEALRAAIALYVNARNRQPIRTLWRDETTGALDDVNVSRYMAMLRRIQQLGGVYQVLFVTHDPEAWDLADAQIRVKDGQISIARPPYSDAA